MALRFCLSKVPIYFRTGPQHPTPNIQHPTSNTQHPTPNIQHPTSNTQHPTSNTQHPKRKVAKADNSARGESRKQKVGPSSPRATPRPVVSQPIATCKPPTCGPHATFVRPQYHPRANESQGRWRAGGGRLVRSGHYQVGENGNQPMEGVRHHPSLGDEARKGADWRLIRPAHSFRPVAATGQVRTFSCPFGRHEGSKRMSCLHRRPFAPVGLWPGPLILKTAVERTEPRIRVYKHR
jgi:hypothetical protein